MKITREKFDNLDSIIAKTAEDFAKIYCVLNWSESHWETPSNTLKELVAEFKRLISDNLNSCLEKSFKEGDDTYCSCGGVRVVVTNYENLPEIEILAELKSIYTNHKS